VSTLPANLKQRLINVQCANTVAQFSPQQRLRASATTNVDNIKSAPAAIVLYPQLDRALADPRKASKGFLADTLSFVVRKEVWIGAMIKNFHR